MKRNPDAGTPGLLTRKDCSRRESRADRILECINRVDCDHLYQRVTQCARAFPRIKPVWSTKAAARNYYDRSASLTAYQANFLPQRYYRNSCYRFPIMISLWIFLAICPVALGSLLVFASHIDPLSGRWRGAQLLGSLGPRADQMLGEHVERLGSSIKKHASAIACSESPSTGS